MGAVLVDHFASLARADSAAVRGLLEAHLPRVAPQIPSFSLIVGHIFSQLKAKVPPPISNAVFPRSFSVCLLIVSIA